MPSINMFGVIKAGRFKLATKKKKKKKPNYTCNIVRR